MRNAFKVVFAIVFTAAVAAFPANAAFLRHAIAAYNRQDFVRAAADFLDLARHGNAKAQTYLGFMYSTGRGVPQNYVLAADWYLCAAEQGEPQAQYLLGQLYNKGHGVPEDYVEAHKWLNLAAAHAPRSFRDASKRLRDAVATKMTRRQLAESRWRAVEWAPHRLPCEEADF